MPLPAPYRSRADAIREFLAYGVEVVWLGGVMDALMCLLAMPHRDQTHEEVRRSERKVVGHWRKTEGSA